MGSALSIDATGWLGEKSKNVYTCESKGLPIAVPENEHLDSDHARIKYGIHGCNI